MKKSCVHLFIALVTLFLYPDISRAADNPVNIQALKVEYAETPLGIDVENPRFSWQMISPEQERGCRQTAYQLIVTDELGKEVWNTGKTSGDLSLNIEYAGSPLQPATRYSWLVNVWDQDNKQSSATSWFETGLMGKDRTLKEWSGAKWIGGGDEDMVLYSHYLPVFALNFSVQLDRPSASTRAGFVYGANDERLMSPYKNIYHLENARNESFLAVELDITPLASGKEAVLNIYRAGYHPDDKKGTPYKSFPIPSTLINEKNKYGKQTISLQCAMGLTRFYVNGDGKEHEVAELNLNPLGQGGDFIAFPVVGDIGFRLPAGQTASFSDIEIRHFRSPSNVIRAWKPQKTDFQETPDALTDNLVIRENTLRENTIRVTGSPSGTLLTATPDCNASPMLRTVFSSGQPIAKARLYVTARGIYEMYMNGKRIGSDYFNPGLTQYNKTHLYQTYDVTPYIHSGENALGALLAEGWWSGGSTYSGENWNFFGDRQSLLAKLVITYADGQEEVIVSDPASWQYFNDGPIRYGSFFQGEVYDARKEKLTEGWSTATYDASGWKPACEVPLHAFYPESTLTAQFGQTVKAIKELTALSVEEVRPGVFVYDMGQNMAGIPRINLSGLASGIRINLRFAEVKYPDLPEYEGNVGMIMLENIRGAMAQDIYLAKGGNETISPRFTYHGYRFVEITGIDRPLRLEAVKGTVISSIDHLASHYETSNPKVNKLWENITWSTYANFLSIPTDCPQRNERLGWSGDISVFSRTATYLADVPQFLRRHLHAMRDVQREDGRFPDVAPLGGGFGGILWGSAGITATWESYQQYADKALLAEHYDAMKQYIHYIKYKTIDPVTGILVQDRVWGDLGDWLGPEDNKNDKSLLWEAYFLYDLDIMQRIATILDKKDDAVWYQKLYTERKAFFNCTYLQSGTCKTVSSGFGEIKKGDPVDTQTSYVLPLVFNLTGETERETLVKNLKETITRTNKADNAIVCPPYSLMTGFIGTSWISKVLSDNGQSDMAYRLLQQTSYPSWLYSVDQGATTIWERLNSYTHLDGFGGNNRMNSFNHYSFGAVGAWMYNYSLGIQRDENTPAFKHFILQPEIDPTGEMTFARGYYDSPYGRIESSWQVKKNEVNYNFTIPANTEARLYLPASSADHVKEGGKPFKKQQGIEYIENENGKIILKLSSGKYFFTVSK